MPIDFEFDDVSRGVLAAGIQPILPAGTVALRKADVVQSGDSLVDFVRHVAGGETLEGAFDPPRSPHSGQSFELIVEREPDRPGQRFVWSGAANLRGQARGRSRLPVGDAPGLVRVRLLAHGRVPPDAGRGLTIDRRSVGGSREPEPTAVAETQEHQPPKPPRLVIVYVMDALRADTVGAPRRAPRGLAHLGPPGPRGSDLPASPQRRPQHLPSTKALFTGRPFVTRGDSKLAPDEGDHSRRAVPRAPATAPACSRATSTSAPPSAPTAASSTWRATC